MSCRERARLGLWRAGGRHPWLGRAVGTSGTLIVRAQSGDLMDPRDGSRPPVPEEWKPLIRSDMPAYDPLRTPTRALLSDAPYPRR